MFQHLRIASSNIVKVIMCDRRSIKIQHDYRKSKVKFRCELVFSTRFRPWWNGLLEWTMFSMATRLEGIEDGIDVTALGLDQVQQPVFLVSEAHRLQVLHCRHHHVVWNTIMSPGYCIIFGKYLPKCIRLLKPNTNHGSYRLEGLMV